MWHWNLYRYEAGRTVSSWNWATEWNGENASIPRNKTLSCHLNIFGRMNCSFDLFDELSSVHLFLFHPILVLLSALSCSIVDYRCILWYMSSVHHSIFRQTLYNVIYQYIWILHIHYCNIHCAPHHKKLSAKDRNDLLSLLITPSSSSNIAPRPKTARFVSDEKVHL